MYCTILWFYIRSKKFCCGALKHFGAQTPKCVHPSYSVVS